MKQKSIYWSVLILFTAFPILLDAVWIEEMGITHQFIWSLFLIPSILIMNLYPNWKVIIGSAIFYTALKFATEFSHDLHIDVASMTPLILSSLVNWSIHLTIGYFINKSYKLLLQVEELTITDSLTGIYNRRYFDLFLEKAVQINQRSKSPLIIMALDIDHFKKLNDTYGHLCGDEALKHIATIIKRNVRGSDAYVRFGGEEFAIILPNTTVEEGKIIAERIRKIIENTTFSYNKKDIVITISIGIAVYNGEKIEKFIDMADKALYKAKANGRNQVAVYDVHL
ncbi:GGDEF domain-containing protein [Bacillus sp. Marseille-P3661]|uniref:GGDEF domain-containing protein n=1 Tax=Bacillus sp. Marseille-P3661 TaxID=1936234 RepID=UPI000C85A216|nr:GGDEF domain-containing protein [Bacillus sp. Marseille-P3661]